MSNVKCLGSESHLDKCSFIWAAEGECNHTADVVVDCYGGNVTGQPSTPAECEVSQLQELLTLARDKLTRERDARQTELRSVTDEMSSISTNLTRELDARQTQLRSITNDVSSLSTKLSSRYFLLLVLWSTETQMTIFNVCHVVKQT